METMDGIDDSVGLYLHSGRLFGYASGSSSMLENRHISTHVHGHVYTHDSIHMSTRMQRAQTEKQKGAQLGEFGSTTSAVTEHG